MYKEEKKRLKAIKNKERITRSYYSKKVKLPKFIDTDKKDKDGKPILKELWKKGKSKFLMIRLLQEKKKSINELL